MAEVYYIYCRIQYDGGTQLGADVVNNWFIRLQASKPDEDMLV